MNLTFLGTGGGSGMPSPFCRCDHCEAMRAAGGKSLRRGPAVLVNDDLLLDCGPSVYESIRALGLRLDALRTLVITHRHSDHLDPWFFWGRRRSAVRGADLPLLTVYAPQDALDAACAFYRQSQGWDRATFEAETRTAWHPVRAGMIKLVGRYRLHCFPTDHGGDDVETVLVGVADGLAAYLHAYDSGPFLDAMWAMLRDHRFDAVALDAGVGHQQDAHITEHMTPAQVIAHARRMREEGILKPGGVALATHFLHYGSGTHEDLVAEFEPGGVIPAYDGLTLSLREGRL